MVEIDYYSKYLKYKQKNLQVGGVNIALQIKMEFNQTKLYDYTNQIYMLICDENSIIGDEIQKFLIKHKIMYKTYTLQHKNKEEEYKDIKDVTKTFSQLKIKEGKIKINIILQ